MLTFISLSKFVEQFKARKMRTRRQRVKQFSLPMEALESRVLPAATIIGLPGAPADTATFTDASGDTVTVRVSGTSGTATFTDAAAGAVDDDDDIAGVAITGASSDFTLTYSFDASGDLVDADPITLGDQPFDSDDTVLMGDITSDRVIKGVYSVPLNDAGSLIGSFTLGSFVGPGFSLHGGLSADDLIGRTADDLGVDIASLGANRSLNFRRNIDGDVLIRGNLNGNIAFGSNGVTATSDLTVRGGVGASAAISGAGDYAGTATFVGVFAGSATISGGVNGNWTFQSSVPASARLLASNWDNVDALGNFGGRILSTGGIDLDVGDSLTKTANLSADDDINLNVTGSIHSGARISTSDDVDATVGGNVSGIFTAGSDLTLDVGGSLVNATLTIGEDGDLTIDRGIRKTAGTFGEDLTIEVTGGITDSVLNAFSGMSLDVTGSVTRSQLNSTSHDATVDISGNLVDSQVNSGSENLTLNVVGNIVNSKVLSDESDISVTVGGNVARSSFAAGDLIELTVGGNITSSSIVGNENEGDDNDVSVTVTGSITKTTILSPDGNTALDVGGNVVNCSISGSGMEFDITGSLTNSKVTVDEGEMSISVGLDVTGSTLTVLDNDLTLEVGRDLIGTAISAESEVSIDVTRHMTRSSVTSTASDSDVRLDVGGNMTDSSVTSAESDITATVGGNFTNSSLTTDEDINLTVTGSARGTITSSEEGITLTVGGSFTGKVFAEEDVVAVLGSLNGSLASRDLDLFVHGNVSASSVIQAVNVGDQGDADVIGFRVGGTFAGRLTAINFDSNEDFLVEGGDGINDLVLGNVLATAKFNIGLFSGAEGELYRFGGSFLGHLSIAQSFNMDLEFNGNVHSIVIGGTVGVTQISTIEIIGGTLTFLSSNSLFNPTAPGEGDFNDGDGNTTGNLISAGFKTVVPQETP